MIRHLLYLFPAIRKQPRLDHLRCDYDDFWIPVSSFWCVFYLTVEFVTIEDAKEVSEFDLVFSEVFDDGDELLEEAVEPFK